MNKNLIKITAVMLSTLTFSTMATPYSSANGNKYNSYSRGGKQQYRGSKGNPRRQRYAPKDENPKPEPQKPEIQKSKTPKPEAQKPENSKPVSSEIKPLLPLSTKPNGSKPKIKKTETPEIKDSKPEISKAKVIEPEIQKTEDTKIINTDKNLTISVTPQQQMGRLAYTKPDYLKKLIEKDPEQLVPLINAYPELIFKLTEEHPEVLTSLIDKHPNLIVSSINNKETLEDFFKNHSDFLSQLARDNEEFLVLLAEKHTKILSFLSNDHPEILLPLAEKHTRLLVSLISNNSKFLNSLVKNSGFDYLKKHYNCLSHCSPTSPKFKKLWNEVKNLLYKKYNVSELETPKVEDSKSETPKTEDLKSEISKAEDSKPETLKTEDSKSETLKTEDSKLETPKTEDSKSEISKEECLNNYYDQDSDSETSDGPTLKYDENFKFILLKPETPKQPKTQEQSEKKPCHYTRAELLFLRAIKNPEFKALLDKQNHEFDNFKFTIEGFRELKSSYLSKYEKLITLIEEVTKERIVIPTEKQIKRYILTGEDTRMFLNALEKRDFVNELSKYTDFHGLKLTNLNEFTELKNCYPEKYKKLVIFLDHFLGRNRIDEDVTLYTDSENETSNAEGYNYYTFNCNFLDGLIQSNSDLEYLIMKLNSIKNKFLYMDSSEFCIINDNKNIPTLCLKKRKSYGTKPPVININNDIDKDYDWVSYVYDKTTLESGFPCRCKYKTYVNYKLDMVVTFKLDDNGQLFNLVSIGSSKAFVYDFLLNPKSFSLGVNMCLHSHNINSYYNSLVVDIMASVEKIVTNSAKTKFNFSFEDILKCELLKSQMYR